MSVRADLAAARREYLHVLKHIKHDHTIIILHLRRSFWSMWCLLHTWKSVSPSPSTRRYRITCSVVSPVCRELLGISKLKMRQNLVKIHQRHHNTRFWPGSLEEQSQSTNIGKTWIKPQEATNNFAQGQRSPNSWHRASPGRGALPIGLSGIDSKRQHLSLI